MAFTLILICLVIQRWFHFDSYTRRHAWFEFYYARMQAYFSSMDRWSGVSGALLVMLPAFLVFLLVFSVVYHLLGAVAYYLLNGFILWYCMDARYLSQVRAGPFKARELLALYYEHVFALIFWYLIFGLAGVVLYQLVSELRAMLEVRSSEKGEEALLAGAIEIEGFMDWVPLRLLGLSYAVVGQFGSTFKLWLHEVMTGVRRTREQASEWGVVALDFQMDDSMSDEQLVVMEQFINRALVVWLVVIGLFTAGMWFG